MIVVDHLHPRHDAFCRCRSCKPPLSEHRRDFRLVVGMYGLAAVVIGVLAGRGA